MWLLYLLGLVGLNELASIDNKLAKNKSQNNPQTSRFIQMNDGKGHQFVIDQNNINVNAKLNLMWCTFWKAFLVFGLCFGFSAVVVLIMTMRGKFSPNENALQSLFICIGTIGALITFLIVRSGLKYMKKRGRISLPDLGAWSTLLFAWCYIFYFIFKA